MLQVLRERRALLFLIAVVASLFVIMAVQVRQGAAAGSETFLLRLTSPLVRAASTVTGGVTGLWDRYVNLRHTRSRNAALEEKVTQLELEMQKLEEARLQNERLRALLDLKEGMALSSVAASVIANNYRGLSHTILVDRGSASGVKPNMAVVSAQGVIGRVWTVTGGISKIQLITDASAGTAVLVQRTRVEGILLGRGSPMCELEYVPTLEDVQQGDLLVTSGLDQIYPKGLPVGRVGEIGPSEGILKGISVIPRVEFERLEEVLILLTSDLSGNWHTLPQAAAPLPVGTKAERTGSALPER